MTKSETMHLIAEPQLAEVETKTDAEKLREVYARLNRKLDRMLERRRNVS